MSRMDMQDNLEKARKAAMATYKQTSFIDMRLQAMEAVLLNASWWSILFNRRGLMDRINRLHVDMKNEHDVMLEKAKKEMMAPKIIAPTQKLSVIGNGR